MSRPLFAEHLGGTSDFDLGGANGGVIKSITIANINPSLSTLVQLTVKENGSSGAIILDVEVAPSTPTQFRFNNLDYQGQLHVTLGLYASITVEVE